MISTGVEMQSGSHGIRAQNAFPTNVFGDNRFIGLESDSTGTSRAIKNGNIPDLKKTLFGLTSIPSKHFSRTTDYPHVSTEHEGWSCDALESWWPCLAAVELLIDRHLSL